MIILILLLLLVPFFYAQSNWIVTEEVAFSHPQIPAAFDGYRIVQVSDLHGKLFGKEGSRLLDQVAAAEPDLIVITGDLIDRTTKDFTVLAPVLAGLSKLAPTYFVTGNHEWDQRSQLPELLELLSFYDIQTLGNQWVYLEQEGEQIVLAGVHDPNAYADQVSPETLLKTIPTECFTLLLAHRNDDYPDYAGYDLTLAGHAHGGLIRLPFTDGLIDHQMTLFPSYTSGFYPLGSDGAIFVSRGLGNSMRMPLRLFNRPHLPVIVLRAEQ